MYFYFCVALSHVHFRFARRPVSQNSRKDRIEGCGTNHTKRKDAAPSSLSPTSLKKRRVLEERSQNINTPTPVVGSRGGMKQSSQNIKSSFEEDLNRLTQEIGEVGDSTHPLYRLQVMGS